MIFWHSATPFPVKQQQKNSTLTLSLVNKSYLSPSSCLSRKIQKSLMHFFLTFLLCLLHPRPSIQFITKSYCCYLSNRSWIFLFPLLSPYAKLPSSLNLTIAVVSLNISIFPFMSSSHYSQQSEQSFKNIKLKTCNSFLLVK